MTCSSKASTTSSTRRYTARMEEELDEIEEGKLAWQDALREFYGKFSKDLENAAETIKGKKKMSIPTDEICEKVRRRMVIKFGRFGQFLACSTYPECQNTREVAARRPNGESADGEQPEEIPACELCGREMALKKGRFGSFYGCTGYPECKNIRKIAKGDQKPAAPPVPLGRDLPERRSESGQKAGTVRRVCLVLRTIRSAIT